MELLIFLNYVINFMISFWLTVVCLFFINPSLSQVSIIVPKTANGLQVIDNKELFVKTVEVDSNKTMVSLKSFIPLLGLGLRYATKDNFMHRRMYCGKIKDTYLRLPAAKA